MGDQLQKWQSAQEHAAELFQILSQNTKSINYEKLTFVLKQNGFNSISEQEYAKCLGTRGDVSLQRFTKRFQHQFKKRFKYLSGLIDVNNKLSQELNSTRSIFKKQKAQLDSRQVDQANLIDPSNTTIEIALKHANIMNLSDETPFGSEIFYVVKKGQISYTSKGCQNLLKPEWVDRFAFTLNSLSDVIEFDIFMVDEIAQETVDKLYIKVSEILKSLQDQKQHVNSFASENGSLYIISLKWKYDHSFAKLSACEQRIKKLENEIQKALTQHNTAKESLFMLLQKRKWELLEEWGAIPLKMLCADLSDEEDFFLQGYSSTSQGMRVNTILETDQEDKDENLKSLRGSEVNFFIGKSIMSAKRANRVLKDERPPLFYMQDNYENGERPNGDNHEKMKVNERKKGYRVEDSFLFKGICLATELPPLCLASDFKVSRFFTKKKALPN